jgi:cold shock CspA family protein
MGEFNGKVKFFDKTKGYGFIVGNHGGADLFVHFSKIKAEGFKTLLEGQTVQYNLDKDSARGLTATDVEVPERNNVVEHNTEDKGYWCRKGEEEEEAFVREIVPHINRNLVIHPDKKKRKTTIDLLNTDNNTLADLKTQSTPFFSAGQYKYDPQYTVTFNHKDYVYYSTSYPNAYIYFWVNWKQLSYGTYTVEPLYGVWEVPFSYLKENIQAGRAVLHKYKHRVGDKINATESYLFDLQDFHRLI